MGKLLEYNLVFLVKLSGNTAKFSQMMHVMFLSVIVSIDYIYPKRLLHPDDLNL